MKNDPRTPETLFHEIADYLLTHYNTHSVHSENVPESDPNGALNTISGTVAHHFAADFILQFNPCGKRLTLAIYSREEGNTTSAMLIYRAEGEHRVLTSETWNSEEDEEKAFDNRDFNDNLSLGMVYVNLVLSFIENLA